MNENTTWCISVIWLEMTILLHVKLYWLIQGSAQNFKCIRMDLNQFLVI
jgi:hypothetical protein